MKINIGEDLMKKYGPWIKRIYLRKNDILLSVEQDPEFAHSLIVVYESKDGRTGAFTIYKADKMNFDMG